MLRGEESVEPVIVDFGLAAFADAQDYILYRCGTPGYVAPEITTLVKGQRVDPVCDVFSAGAIFHVLLVRRALFEGRGFDEVYENNRRLRFNLAGPLYQDVDPVAMDLLARMLRADPRERIRAEEILLHPFLRGWAMEEEKEGGPASTLVSSRVTAE
jgi:serine/threonine protein kinase